MTPKSRLSLFFLCIPILLLGMTACKSTPPTPVIQEVLPPPASLRILASELMRQSRSLTDLKSIVKTTVRTQEKEQTLKQLFLIKGSNDMRMDTLNMFGQPMGVLISHKQRLTLYDTNKNKLIKGYQVLKMMQDTFGTVIDPSEYIRIFLGNVPHVQEIKWQKALYDDKTKRYQMVGFDIKRKERIFVELDTEKLIPYRMQKWLGRLKVYTAFWDDYEMVEGRWFPHRISVVRSTQKDRISVSYQDPQINRGIPEEAFQLNLPETASPSS